PGNCHRDRQQGKKPSREIVHPVEVHQLFGEAEISRKADFAPSPPLAMSAKDAKTQRDCEVNSELCCVATFCSKIVLALLPDRYRPILRRFFRARPRARAR